MSTIVEGRVLTPDGWVRGRLAFTSTIVSLTETSDAPLERFILPGFVDPHVHGGAGADCMEGEAATRRMARFHAGHGTTSLLATTVTAPASDLRAALDGIGATARQRRLGEARVAGAHLEGPFISTRALGAQPPYAIPPDLALVADLCARAPLLVTTMAPEIDPDHALLRCFREHGVRVQIGHTTGTYEDAVAAMDAGASGFTHLFNAMTAMHHRAPGIAGAALAHAGHAEIILDFLHVGAGAAAAALRAIPNLYGITDAVAATGMPDGSYRLGRHRVLKDDTAVRLEDGTLAGSTLTMDQVLRNLLALGLPLDDASRRTSTIAADYLGFHDRGRLVPGALADLVVLDDDHRVEAVFVGGEEIDLTDA